ncbi:TPA: non-ribosomal peptide synthetase [Pseudomonas putida]|uniref:Amino acid adenylation domain protein n=1 Tax=Pseudomonas putida (strain GB-1) TaxID=76869 RepID=B0KS53_PSEPG|nr:MULTISPECIES: non-ribosomal peptide synthetase [Pseudomonas]ABY99976.1 amino acid adenylation domain protein [Pseudomonas putida GB-1]APF00153.1 non-ribosomal peptide synthetase [Pseudomonas putida]MBP0707945.1 non-ribosomal peptide synthetase [Pseudomonas sp. T34]MCE1003033.1 non-ribosomal peptide synthetase [Pseudomonas sp. NMI1173_11]MCK2187383.1 non-ribosomal peptide synthetase [Pseudomonas sp. MB04B]
MNADQTLKLARRFIELSPDKRRLFLKALQGEGMDFSVLPIAPGVEVAERDQLSYAQRRMWFLWQLDPQGAAYNLPMAVRLHGPLDLAALQQAFDALVARHETLRTRFVADGDDVRQQVDAVAAPLQLRQDALASLDETARQAAIERIAEAEALAPFDLASGPLLRVRLLQLAAQEHVLLLTLHHIVADGWSMNVLIDEFLHLYEAAVAGTEATLDALPIQYRDFALWQRSWLEAGEQERQLAYWQARLGEDHSPLELPLDRARQGRPSYRGARHEFPVAADVAERLRGVARKHNVTLFMVLLAAFKLLLQRYSGQAAIRVGVPIANRNRAEGQGLIGCFINTQVLHTEIDPLLDIAGLLQRVRETAVGAQSHQDLPFEQLVEALDLPRSSESPLFRVLFNHQAQVADVQAIETRSGLSLAPIALEKHSARFDLALDTHERAGQLHAAFTYATDVFEAATIEALGEQWLALVQALAAETAGAVGELALPGLAATLGAPAQAAESPSVQQRFAAAASRHPERIAVVAAGEQASFAELDARAEAIASRLVKAGVGPDTLVGVLADRSVGMLASILGVLKAGGAYLPLEPEQPAERLAYMLTDSGTRRVLAPGNWQAELPAAVQHLDWAQAGNGSVARTAPAAANLAYVIYTSGTTGQPKGVAISHGALANYVDGMSARLPVERIRSMAQVSTPAADLGHTMLFGALCGGHTLHLLLREQVLDAEGFAAYLAEHQVDALKIVPSHLEAMLVAGRAALPSQCLVLGGEAISPGLLGKIRQLAPALKVFNHYGPTETTVGVLVAELSEQSSLGQPLANTRVAVLDRCLQPLPAKAKGELYIGGAGLARGYLNRPSLTAERFVPDPHGSHGQRLYRSGDWVRQGNDLQFAGRMDGQVKIRGYRVELAEIENQLRALDGVANALVRVQGQAPQLQLAAWLVPSEMPADCQAWQDSTRATLKSRLPEHMVPTHLMVLEHLPVTANGKVDVKALPEPVATLQAYQAPESPLQVQLATIWAEVLQVPQVGLTDNFFALGGHSLLATQAVSRVRKQLGVDIPLRTLFDTVDLLAFAQAVAEGEQGTGLDIEILDRQQPLPVSRSQNRQWLFWKLNPQSLAYNTPMAVRMQGNLDRSAVQAALDALAARHESLRTVFVEADGLPWQRILPAATVPIGFEDLSGQDHAAQLRKLEAEAFVPFDLEHGPLLRARLFKVNAQEHLLSLTLHHIVSDGWSMSLLVREFAAVYNAAATGRQQAIEPLPVQYADFAAWQRKWLAEGQMQAQIDYWKARLEDDFEVLELPADRIRPQVKSYQGSRFDVRLPLALTERLRALAVASNATLFHVFLAAYAIVLSRYSRKDTLNIGVPVTNRNRLELEGLIGFFINVVVARIGVDGSQPFPQLLAAIKETTLQAQANKDVPFLEVAEALYPDREQGVNPFFQVLYNHLRDLGEQVSSDALHGLQVKEVDLLEPGAQYDISLNTLERSDGVTASFNYSTDLFDAARIERMAGHWQALLEAICAEPQRCIGELGLLGSAEHQQLTHGWNPASQASSGLCAHQLLEHQASLRPDAVALIFDDQQMTYAELDRCSNQLAHRLRALGVGPDRLVGVAVERGLGMALALVAIHKAGGAYVPLDPDYPQERLAYMVEDSSIGLLLADVPSRERLQLSTPLPCVVLEPGNDWLSAWPAEPLANLAAPENLAYVIYTSGSTGMPKGVAIDHHALSVFCQVAGDYSRLSPNDRVLQFATFSFDGFIEQFFPPLAQGACVVLRDLRLWDTATLLDEINRHDVTVADLPAAYWRLLALERRAPEAYGRLKQIHVGGEAVPEDALRAWLADGPTAVRLLNTYGPTEATVVATTYDCSQMTPQQISQGGVPIGRAIPGRSLHALDDGLAPTPVGVPGELFIGGAGCLARGYHQRPSLTAERFIPDPFDPVGGGRLYRTGDLGCYDENGQLAYRGRADHQVKVRGFRIELGEIEQYLRAHPDVREATVLAIDLPAGKQLCAYAVPVEGHDGDLRLALKHYLKASLPDYMIPSYLVTLPSMPLTPSGKLDRKALPLPDPSQPQHDYEAPQTERQQQLANIWAQLLSVARVGLNDNFFELGGHSLLAAQAVSRINVELGLDIPLRLIFTHPELRAFALALDEQALSLTDDGLSDIEKMMNAFTEA